MEYCWKLLPRELLSEIFVYLDYKYTKTEIIRWMNKSDVKHMLRGTSFEQFVREKNITGCILSKEYSPRQKINWTKISKIYKLSNSFIHTFSMNLDWFWLSCKQKLSEELIDEYNDRVDWYSVSLFQKLSEKFISKYNKRLMIRRRKITC